ncbi:hypothetical protein COC44_02585 [Bacillus cereus]|nr:hypothetical protein COC44_02585 [Bacillus cereus]
MHILILEFILILSISGFHTNSIHIIYKIDSDAKAVSVWSFVDRINFKNLKGLTEKYKAKKLKALQ